MTFHVPQVALSFRIAHRRVVLPHPALHASHAGIWIADRNGTRRIGRGEAIRIAADTPVILMNAPLVGQRLGYAELSGLDLLELFAFLRPARFMVPTAKGLAAAAGIDPPADDAAVAPFLLTAADALMALASGDWPEREGAWTAMRSLGRLGWPWAPALAAQIAKPVENERWLFAKLPEWDEGAPRPAPRTVPVDLPAVDARLSQLTGDGAEERPGQRAYAEAAAAAFGPRAVRDSPNLVLAEAGTGTGKTLGYLAPASRLGREEQGRRGLDVSTFTKPPATPDRSGELERLIPDPRRCAARRVVVAQGPRELPVPAEPGGRHRQLPAAASMNQANHPRSA